MHIYQQSSILNLSYLSFSMYHLADIIESQHNRHGQRWRKEQSFDTPWYVWNEKIESQHNRHGQRWRKEQSFDTPWYVWNEKKAHLNCDEGSIC